MADNEPKVRKPQDWEKVVSCAYLRSIGQTHEVAAKAAGVGERTLYDWENEPWWPDAVREAHGRWLSGIAEKAKRALANGLDASDQQSARWALERLYPELAPPKQRTEHSSPDGSAPEFVVRFVKPSEPGGK